MLWPKLIENFVAFLKMIGDILNYFHATKISTTLVATTTCQYILEEECLYFQVTYKP